MKPQIASLCTGLILRFNWLITAPGWQTAVAGGRLNDSAGCNVSTVHREVSSIQNEHKQLANS